MSFDAIRWALAQPVEKSSAKFLLVAMASCVNGDGSEMLCWPSVQHLADTTGQDRKTVIDGLRRLREAGFATDTGARKGVTGQVAVYRLNSPKTGTVSPASSTPPQAADTDSNSTENGTGTENGTVPKTDTNSTAFPYQESQISLETVPKTGHGTSKEPVMKKEGTRKRVSGFDASTIVLPDWLDRSDWCRWCKDRKTRNKRITEDAAKLQLSKLAEYRVEGHSPTSVIDHSIASGYTGLFPPKRASSPATTKHAGFSGKNYREGVSEDGSFQ